MRGQRLLICILLISFDATIFSQSGKLSVSDSPNGEPSYTYLNNNNISTLFKNNGISDIDVSETSARFVFPKGSGKTSVYISGLLWGAKIAGDPQVKVGGSTYLSGLQGGKILSPGVAEDPDLEHVRVYRVRYDVFPGGPNVDLSVEAIDEGKSEAEIRAQYELDWTEWPAASGAPYFDGNQNSMYDPDPSSGDSPGIFEADQTIWFVANDLDSSKTVQLYGTNPIGIEYQASIWSYAQTGALGNTIFRRYKLINKSNNSFDSMYISMWSDTDIGYVTDDFAGCDTLLDLGYCYNAMDIDPVYTPLPPPAVGFDLIRGPLVEGNPGEDRNKNGIEDIYDQGINESNERVSDYINLPMTAFYYFSPGDITVMDPTLGSPAGATQFYNFMQGKVGFTGQYFINPTTLLPTTYALSGDPQTGTGWIDGMLFGPSDRRIGLATGPFNMLPGESQTIVIAEIAAGAIPGVDRLAAIGLLKYYDQLVQIFYDQEFPVSIKRDNNNIIPANFNLYQNYPNPFNPKTIISYSVPATSNVTIKIFDLLGRELTTLINEEKQAGEYSLEFDADNLNLTNGVFFYQFQVGSFIETKKMILVK